MLRKFFAFACGALLMGAVCTAADTDNTKLSETFGHLISRSIDNPIINFDLESIIKGMRDSAAGLSAPMTEEQFEEVIATLQDESFQQLADANLKQAEEFLSSNRNSENIVEVETGMLQYQVLQEAPSNAASVAEGNTPVIHYKGMCLDGTVFGDSAQVGGPITVPLDQTIAGFSKGIVGMKVGEKRKLFVHPEMAYGVGGDLPPNSLLVFEVELVDVGNNAIADEDQETLSTSMEANG